MSRTSFCQVSALRRAPGCACSGGAAAARPVLLRFTAVAVCPSRSIPLRPILPTLLKRSSAASCASNWFFAAQQILRRLRDRLHPLWLCASPRAACSARKPLPIDRQEPATDSAITRCFPSSSNSTPSSRSRYSVRSSGSFKVRYASLSSEALRRLHSCSCCEARACTSGCSLRLKR